MGTSLRVTIIKGIALPLCAIFLVGKFNLFESIAFVPDGYSFEIGLTTYFVILDFLYFKLSRYIDLNHKATIECLFYSDELSKQLTNTPAISFVEDVSYINCCITVKGVSKKLTKNILTISFPNWVDVQETNGSIGTVNEKNQFIIDLSKVTCKDNKIEEGSTVDIKIGLIRNLLPDNYSMIIAPKIKEQLLIKFSYNKFKLCN